MRSLLNPTRIHQATRTFTTTARNMGVEKTTLQEGNGPSPQKGDRVTMEYTVRNFDVRTACETNTDFVRHDLGLAQDEQQREGQAVRQHDWPWTFPDTHWCRSCHSRMGRGCRADEAWREGEAGYQLRLRLWRQVSIVGDDVERCC
jgi:hypothetical protein